MACVPMCVYLCAHDFTNGFLVFAKGILYLQHENLDTDLFLDLHIGVK